MVENLFVASDTVNYDRYRPYFHPLVFARVTQLTSTPRFSHALDIGCGTGQSTQALADVVDVVVGVDTSASMLSRTRHRGFSCTLASAEALPLASDTFDLVSIGSAFHWFDRPTALRESRRVLRAGGWLVIFNSWFTGTMRERDDFPTWQQEYLQRYPTPPRHVEPLSDDAFAEAGFREVVSERFEHEHEFTLETLIGYLMTQTNVTAAVASGAHSSESICGWMTATLEPFFASHAATFVYGGTLSLYEVIGRD